MLGRLDLGVDPLNDSLRVNQVGNPFGARLGGILGDAVGYAHRPVNVREKVEGKVELFAKSAVCRWGVKTGAEDYDVFGVELLDSIPESVAFDRSPRRIGHGIPPQHHVASPKLLQGNRLVFLVRKRKGRGSISHLQ